MPINPLSNVPSSARRGWWSFCLLIGLVFMLRGQAVLQVYPSMEGFDEVQHTAYLIHLAEQGTLPVLRETLVPRSLYPEIVNNPHSDLNVRQVGEVGGRAYRHFYDAAPTTNLAPDILLFQAQHPPVYYLATWRLFDHVRERFGYREAVYALRSIQLALGAAALVLLLSTLPVVFADPGIARLAAVVISLLPMFLIYILRVSNDALAVLFAALVFVLLARIRDDRGLVLKAIAIGFLLAAGAMTKTIAFLFLPVALAYLFVLLFDRSFSRLKVLAGLVLIPAIYLACCYRYHVAAEARFGTRFPALETILNAEKGYTLADLLGTIRVSDAWTFFVDRLIVNNVWKSGMTFLEPDARWEWSIAALIGLGVIGLVAHLARPAGRAALVRPATARYLLLCLLSVGATFAGAYAHGLNCRLAWGALITPAYYVMVAFPALLTVVFYGWTAFPRGVAIVAGSLLGLLYVAVELDALLTVALPYWTNTHDLSEILSRARMLGSDWTEPLLALIWWIIAYALLGLLLLCTFRHLQKSDHAC